MDISFWILQRWTLLLKISIYIYILKEKPLNATAKTSEVAPQNRRTYKELVSCRSNRIYDGLSNANVISLQTQNKELLIL
jgi:hypothetical protein